MPRFYLEDTGIWRTETGDLMVFFHGHADNPETGKPDDYGTMFRVDSGSGEVLARDEGFMWHEPSAWETSALRHFLVDLTDQLYRSEEHTSERQSLMSTPDAVMCMIKKNIVDH